MLAITVSFAQNMLGISTSRYGGTNRLYINPSLAADSPSKLYVNVATANAHVDNNYVRYQAPFSLLRLITGNVPNQYKNSDGTVHFDVAYTKELLNGQPKNGTLWGEVRGPAILVKTGERGAVAITTRFRAVGQVVDGSEQLLSAVRSGLSDGVLYGIPSKNNQVSAATNTYSELGLTYGGTVWEGDGHKLLLGATAKALLGYNAQYLINRGLDYTIGIDANNPNVPYLDVTRIDANLGYTTFLQNRSLSPRTLLSPSAPGTGFGFDVGMTYISQYDADSPALRIGAAITDIGGISYTGEGYSYESIIQNPVRFKSSDFNGIGGSVEIARVIQEKLNTGLTPSRTSFRTGLPTSLNLTADYQLPDKLGISFTYLQNLQSTQAISIHQPTLVSITPRYDTRWISVAVPITYLNRGLMAGASVRVGPAWLGTDNLFGLLGNSINGLRPRGMDIYLGVAFGLGKADYDEE